MHLMSDDEPNGEKPSNTLEKWKLLTDEREK